MKYVAFLRAINVAGHALVKMTDLSAAFAAAGCEGVRTHIQSGNVVFEATADAAPAVFERIRRKLRNVIGGEPIVMFRTVRGLERLVARAPFKGLDSDPAIKLYVVFLAAKPAKKLRFPLALPREALEAIGMAKLNVFVVSRRKKSGFYGFPNNFIEHELGVAATSRNWRTLTNLISSSAAVRSTPRPSRTRSAAPAARSPSGSTRAPARRGR